MGLNISFFRTPKYRVFHYDPIYYDPKKEHIAQVEEEVEREKAQKEGRTLKDEKYFPGKYIHGKIRDSYEGNRKHAMKDSTSKIIGVVALIIFFVLMYYFADYYSLFIESLQR